LERFDFSGEGFFVPAKFLVGMFVMAAVVVVEPLPQADRRLASVPNSAQNQP
jgi:hypothetical protein